MLAGNINEFSFFRNGTWTFSCGGTEGQNVILRGQKSQNSTKMADFQWRSHLGCKGGGTECHPWQQKNCQKSGKRGKKSGKIGKKRRNREENAKIGKGFFFSFCTSWQLGLPTLLLIFTIFWLGRGQMPRMLPSHAATFFVVLYRRASLFASPWNCPWPGKLAVFLPF